MNQKEKVIVLLSGGLDSAVCLWLMKEKDFELYTITFNYFKRFKKEKDSFLIWSCFIKNDTEANTSDRICLRR